MSDIVLGVLGGMGPLASAEFMRQLTLLTPAERDQDHIPTVLWSDPRVPDRTLARLHGGEDPLPALLRGLRGLEAAGCGVIVIPCNTAHGWYGCLQQQSSVPILHIVQAAREQLEVQGIEPGPVGLMGTQATLDMGLYQQGIGRECIVADADMMKRLVSPGIALVKANRVQDAYAPLAEAAGQLRAKGARAVVLGCTEIPLGISAGPRLDFPVIDTVAALALASLRFIRSGDTRVKVPTEPIAGSVG